MNLIHGDCLEELPKLKDKSIDFFYLDLPYGQTACKWDKRVDLTALWIQLKRLAKNERTPFFFSCTTKFGYELIKANEKWFRWDLVWEKNRASGFLNAYKLPMRKHEMIYCFAKKCPGYDVSSHKEVDTIIYKTDKPTMCDIYHKNERLLVKKTHREKLPTSILPPQEDHELIYCFSKKCPEYHIDSHFTGKEIIKRATAQDIHTMEACGGTPAFYHEHKGKETNAPLPTSILPPQEDHELIYCFAKKSPEYDVSSHNEVKEGNMETTDKIDLYGTKDKKRGKLHKERLPTSVIDPDKLEPFGKDRKLYRSKVCHKEPLPTSVLPSSWVKCSVDGKTNHRTSKPIALMEFLLKYWTKEDDVICDATMGAGSMGIACINMNRKFIGIEKDETIYNIAKDRLNKHVKEDTK